MNIILFRMAVPPVNKHTQRNEGCVGRSGVGRRHNRRAKRVTAASAVDTRQPMSQRDMAEGRMEVQRCQPATVDAGPFEPVAPAGPEAGVEDNGPGHVGRRYVDVKRDDGREVETDDDDTGEAATARVCDEAHVAKPTNSATNARPAREIRVSTILNKNDDAKRVRSSPRRLLAAERLHP